MVRDMRRPYLAALTAVAALCLSTLALAPSASAAPSPHGVAHKNTRVCSTAPAGFASCQAVRRDQVTSSGKVAPKVTSVPDGFGPADIRSAYGLGGSATGTVAIVDAYNAPYAETDLAAYRKQYGLPACTTSNGCFKKISQTGSTTKLPRNDGGWAQEISLDLDMVSAACPACKILLVEASTPSFANLGAAVNKAASTPGVVAISNSYGGTDTAAMSAYNHPGIAITASTGDNGYGVQSPASFPGVVAVGGTSLYRTPSPDGRAWSESAWNGAGSGCSSINAKPVWQTTVTQCGRKANADVSAVADPATGVAVYDSYSYQGYSGWMVFGGTSASSPIIASVYAQGSAVAAVQAGTYANVAAYTWAHKGSLNDVTVGSNGTCSTTVWCRSDTGSGWDGPTGLGTPNGVGAF
jgi:subtilase family serine protease